MPENRRLFPRLTVEDNLKMGAFMPEARKRFAERLEVVFDLFPRMKERRNQLAGTMSGGEQQMCAIGRAMMSDPKLLLLDEPSAGLAPVVVQQVFELVNKIRASGLTVLIVEQNVQQVLQRGRPRVSARGRQHPRVGHVASDDAGKRHDQAGVSGGVRMTVIARSEATKQSARRRGRSSSARDSSQVLRRLDCFAFARNDAEGAAVAAAQQARVTTCFEFFDIFLLEAVINGILLGGLLALLALGLNLIFGVIDVTWICYAELVMIGMYGMYFLVQYYGLPYFVAAPHRHPDRRSARRAACTTSSSRRC